MMAISCATQHWVLTYLEAFDTANAKIYRERNRIEKEVIHCVSDLDNNPSKWKISKVRALATVATAVHGHNAPGSCGGTTTVHCGPTLGQCGCHLSHARARSALSGSAKRGCPLKVQVWAESITSSGYVATQVPRRKQRPKPLLKLDKGHSKGSFQDSQRTARRKPRSVQTSQELVRDRFTLLGHHCGIGNSTAASHALGRSGRNSIGHLLGHPRRQ